MEDTDDDGEGYTDVIVFPISKYSVDQMPIFMRERLARECLCLIVDGIAVQEIKWYQKGFFKVLMFIVSIAMAWWSGGATMTISAVVTAVLEVAIAMAVAHLLSSVIDNPLLAALIVIVAALVFGDYSNMTLMDKVGLAVEATGTYLQKKMAQDMLKLAEEAKVFQEEVSEAKKEMNKLEEESGLNHYDSKHILWLSTLPPYEEAEDFFSRALNRDLNTIELDTKVTVRSKLDL